MERYGHEQVIFNYDRATGMKAIIAIHDTSLGPAIGGCRIWPYPSEWAALEDALRLSETMTYKAAAAGVDWGGGKVVVLGDPGSERREAWLRALGRFVQTLGGRLVIGQDLGTNAEDLAVVQRETPHVRGLPRAFRGSGDTGPAAAAGVLAAMEAALTHRFGTREWKGRCVAVQGLGKVGSALTRLLVERGARVVAADIDPQAVGRAAAEWGIEPADPWTILETPCDILAPCALGGVIGEETVERLRCAIVAGSANNPLKEAGVADRLASRGILYAPDFIAGAGGLIQLAEEGHGADPERLWVRVEALYHLMLEIFRTAEREGRSTLAVALDWVEERRRVLNQIHRIYVGSSSS
ncbi:MAG: leucine dehydrogenase [Firmicutes bacterium]|nr:Glu/Leu/Phe/Val dehydrogenase [Alicyclobacillaceae bacterium]MCL6496537.1 leucine dehydrogenase [Bacillota bacterium]